MATTWPQAGARLLASRQPLGKAQAPSAIISLCPSRWGMMLILPVLALAACLSGALAATVFTEARRRRPAPGTEAGALLIVVLCTCWNNKLCSFSARVPPRAAKGCEHCSPERISALQARCERQGAAVAKEVAWAAATQAAHVLLRADPAQRLTAARLHRLLQTGGW